MKKSARIITVLSIVCILVLSCFFTNFSPEFEAFAAPKPEPTVYVTIPPRRSDEESTRPETPDRPDRDNSSSDYEQSASQESRPVSQRKNALSDIVQFSPGSPGQLIGSPGAFTQKILSNNGILNAPVRGMFGNRNSIGFLIKAPSASGHHYVTLNSLGKFNLTIYQVMDLIKQNPDRVFPFLNAAGQNGQQVTEGNVYNLNFTAAGIEFVNNPVKVASVTRLSFTLTTLPGHKLQGSATHGVFIDSTGEMWLFQEGIGVPNEDESLQQGNYAAANIMWGKMSENLKAVIDSTPKAPVIGVPGKTTDGIRYRF